MQKTKYIRIVAAVKKLGTVTAGTTISYILILLLKLFYFDSQIGSGRIVLLTGVATLGSLLILTSISLLLKPKAKLWYMSVLNIIITLIMTGLIPRSSAALTN